MKTLIMNVTNIQEKSSNKNDQEESIELQEHYKELSFD